MSRPYSLNLWLCKPNEISSQVGFLFRSYIEARNAAFLTARAAGLPVYLCDFPKRLKPAESYEIAGAGRFPIVRIERQ